MLLLLSPSGLRAPSLLSPSVLRACGLRPLGVQHSTQRYWCLNLRSNSVDLIPIMVMIMVQKPRTVLRYPIASLSSRASGSVAPCSWSCSPSLVTSWLWSLCWWALSGSFRPTSGSRVSSGVSPPPRWLASTATSPRTSTGSPQSGPSGPSYSLRYWITDICVNASIGMIFKVKCFDLN